MTKKELKLQLMGRKSLQNLWEEIQKWMWWTVVQTSLIKEGYLTPVNTHKHTPDPAHAAGSDRDMLNRLSINTTARSAAAACYMFVPWHGACGLDSLLTFTALSHFPQQGTKLHKVKEDRLKGSWTRRVLFPFTWFLLNIYKLRVFLGS